MSRLQDCRLNESTILRYAMGRWYLIQLKSAMNEYHKPLCINETAADFLILLNKYKSFQAAYSAMGRLYDIPEEDIEKDMEVFVDRLGKINGLPGGII